MGGLRHFVYEVRRGPRRWVKYLQPVSVRKAQERAAHKALVEAVTKMIDTPLGHGLSLRQAAQLPSDLRSDICIALLSDQVRLPDHELTQLLTDPEPIRREYPQLFKERV